MTLRLQQLQHQTRRQFLRNVGQFSLGAIAMEALRATPLKAAAGNAHNPMAVRAPHFAPKAKRVIYLHMSGGPPHLDLFDYKPELVKRDGQLAPDEFVKGKKFAF